MLPQELKPEHFASYPPEARKLAISYVATLRLLPLSFIPGLLREIVEYDFKFPAERSAREKELDYLSGLSADRLKACLSGFAAIHLSPQLESFDWVKSPAQFVEQLSAHLWSTHQLDAFRKASSEYGDGLRNAIPPEVPMIPRLGISIIGAGLVSYDDPLFRKLRPHGAYFSKINPVDGLRALLEVAGSRAQAHPLPYGHWYIDGGEAVDHSPALTCISYQGLEPVRAAVLHRIQEETDRPGMGPEALRTIMAEMRPSDFGAEKFAGVKPLDAVMSRFALSLLSEGSGTQIFSTSFTQWAAREVLRRAQPVTLLVRFAPRQRQRPMNELLGAVPARAELDPLGSLVDADFGAYYNWLNQQRLTGAEQSSFVAWFEGHNQAVAIGPAMARGTESTSAADLKQLLSWTV